MIYIEGIGQDEKMSINPVANIGFNMPGTSYNEISPSIAAKCNKIGQENHLNHQAENDSPGGCAIRNMINSLTDQSGNQYLSGIGQD